MMKYYFRIVIAFAIFSVNCRAQTSGKVVDLGLSVYWASCNVGANSPEDVGGYYAWGEVEEKEIYGNNYAYSYSERSFQDIGTDISGTQYDVAKMKWGNSWRMPTLKECEELMKRCSWKWVSQGGINGMNVTGPNGNSIFLPAGGRKYGEGLRDFNEFGCYWTSTIGGDGVQFFNFDSEGKGIEGRNRINGMTIRPVTSDATATGIVDIKTEGKQTNPVYTPQGQRLDKPRKGINIIGGRKVMVK